MRIILREICFCTTLFLLMFSSGCAEESSETVLNIDNDSNVQSASVVFSDDERAALDAINENSFFEFLGKTYVDEQAREHFKPDRESNLAINDPDWDWDTVTKLTVNHFIISQSRIYSDNRLDNQKCNMNSMIENGDYAIIPRNPYTGEDIKTSLEYSPGDYLIAMNEGLSVFIQHKGLMDSDCYPYLDGYDNLYYVQALGDNEGFVTDGRSEYVYWNYDSNMINSAIQETAKSRKSRFGKKYTNENAKLYWLNQQMFNILSRYSQEYEDVLLTLEDYLSYFGRKNPAAWINPYTGKSMKQKKQFAVCKYIPNEVTDLLDRPELYSRVSEPEYFSKYAGNYSFTVVDGKNGPKAVFVLYFLNRENKLEAMTCYANPNSNHLKAVHEVRKKEREELNLKQK